MLSSIVVVKKIFILVELIVWFKKRTLCRARGQLVVSSVRVVYAPVRRLADLRAR